MFLKIIKYDDKCDKLLFFENWYNDVLSQQKLASTFTTMYQTAILYKYSMMTNWQEIVKYISNYIDIHNNTKKITYSIITNKTTGVNTDNIDVGVGAGAGAGAGTGAVTGVK